jgi:hypothetical protein
MYRIGVIGREFFEDDQFNPLRRLIRGNPLAGSRPFKPYTSQMSFNVRKSLGDPLCGEVRISRRMARSCIRDLFPGLQQACLRKRLFFIVDEFSDLCFIVFG